MADYDNDGHVDIYAPNPKLEYIGGYQGDTQRLYRNNGDGSFQNATSQTGLGAVAALSGAWGDYDGDSFLDLLVAVAPAGVTDDPNWYASSWILYHGIQDPSAPGERGFYAVTPTVAPALATNGEARTALWVDLDMDHDVDLVTIQCRQTDSSSPHTISSRYYRNDSGSLTNVTSSQFPDAAILDTGAFSAALGDIDNDGIVDIAYHGRQDKGWMRNSIDSETGLSYLEVGWNQNRNDTGATCWPIEPTDLDVIDYDLDGWLDMVAPSNSNDRAHVLLHNRSSDNHFTCSTSGLHLRESFGIGAADFDMDGYAELLKACLSGTGQILYRSDVAYRGVGTNHWIGIRLADTDSSCNYRGIGATVVVTAGNHTQAQVVDGGSGRAGQHDLDLSFGLGSYSGMVDVEVIWPCGQTQYEQIASDQYHTITLTKPDIINSTVARHLEFGLGENTLNWKFEWDTTTPSNNALDWVEFPSGLPDSDVTHLDAAMGDVEIAAPQKNANGTYHHCVTWLNQECVAPMSAPYKVHSKVIDFDFPSSQKTLKTLVCPRSE